ncbi:MAG TPA: acyl transferase, partial [Microscillaceae bacterium]|nr:acyl transferase [Microscillaceae bacterium]
MTFAQAFKNKLLDLSPADFEAQAMELFRYQSEHNIIYKKFLEWLPLDPKKVYKIEQIPFLPI